MRTFTFTDEQVSLLLQGVSLLSTETAGLLGALNRPDNTSTWGRLMREQVDMTFLNLLDLKDMLSNTNRKDED